MQDINEEAKKQFTNSDIAAIKATKMQIRDKILTVFKPFSAQGKILIDMNKFYVTGGCIGSLIRNEKPKDYDVYCRDQFFFMKLKSLLENDPLFSDMVEETEESYRDVKAGGKLFTENAITLKGDVQLICKHFGEPKEVRDTFDFVHCTPYYEIGNDKLYISPLQIQLIKEKQLMINNKDNVTLHRISKFLDRGYKSTPEIVNYY